MTLLERVSEELARRGIESALIGATALAAHGVARATIDIDLLAVDPDCLDEGTWADLRASGAMVETRRGDATDPLAGVVRITARDERPVDLIVGKAGWQRELLHRARAMSVGGTEIRVVEAVDLVLLKLYAGGPQDSWDIDQLLDVIPALAAQVEARLSALPAECATLWRRIRTRRDTPGSA